LIFTHSGARRHPTKNAVPIDYVQRNIVLLGDAAHSIHPLAGQGVNLGLLDAAALAEELSRGLQVGRKLADPIVLQRYQRRRIGHNLGMMWLMEGFKHLFAEQALPVRWLRNSGMTAIDNIPAIKNLLARRAMGMDWF
jgi:2-octaprenylphenol hydroxylase